MQLEIVYYVASSLDGFIATADGGVDWLTPFHSDTEDYGFAEFNRSVDGLLMGSRTYEFALEQPAWPAPDQPSWVFTRRSLPLAHPSVTLTPDDPISVTRALTARGLKRVWLMGGGALAGSFERQRLISDYRISVIPVLLGKGIPLFAGTSAGQRRLRLIATQPYSTGVVQLTYRPADPRPGLVPG